MTISAEHGDSAGFSVAEFRRALARVGYVEYF
jgi:hypothetical protein